MYETALSIIALAALFVVAVPLVGAVRHRDERPLAAYLIFMVTFSFVATIVFTTLVSIGQHWPTGANASITWSPTGVLLICFIPALIVGLWMASRPPYDSPTP